jgi:hypothetical protein
VPTDRARCGGVLSFFLSFALLVLGVADGSDGRVSYSFRLLDVRPGCSEDGVGYPVTIVVRVAVANQTSRPLILSREFSAAPYYHVAASVEQSERGEHEANGGDLEIQAGGVPEPKFGPGPERSRFVVVPPGATYETETRTGFLAGDRRALERLAPSRTSGFVLPGQHVIQSTIRTWPYVFVKRGTVEHLRHRWRRIGDLVAETVETPYLPFELPDAMTRCDSR